MEMKFPNVQTVFTQDQLAAASKEKLSDEKVEVVLSKCCAVCAVNRRRKTQKVVECCVDPLLPPRSALPPQLTNGLAAGMTDPCVLSATNFK